MQNHGTPAHATHQAERRPPGLAEYEDSGGYKAARKAVHTMTPQEVQKQVTDSTLRGRGGAGFATGMKWSFVPMGPDAPRPKYLVANADEMEPGTFKDRLLLEGDPHQMVESMIVSAYAIQAEVGYIFLRWAYKRAADLLRQAIAEAHSHGYLGRNVFGSDFNFDLHLHTSAGRYICGEETALLNPWRANVRFHAPSLPIRRCRASGENPRSCKTWRPCTTSPISSRMVSSGTAG